MISPAYGYEAVAGADPAGGGADLHDPRGGPREVPPARPLLARFRLTASPLYLDFLCGRRELPCAAWANPTRNVRGWRGPCYLVADAHYATYRELVEATDWQRLGPDNDPRCRDCLVHCGFEPAAVLAANRRLRDMLKMAVWQMT